MPDKAIAGMLNRTGKRTGRLNGWTQSRVRGFRKTHGIAVYRENEWDDPVRFCKSKAVGPYFGLPPRKYQSGEADWTGHISKVGDETVRTALYEAANVALTRTVKFSALKAWAMRVAKARGTKCAKTALARKLAVVLHRMWVDGTDFRWSRQPS
jgi:transposase